MSVCINTKRILKMIQSNYFNFHDGFLLSFQCENFSPFPQSGKQNNCDEIQFQFIPLKTTCMWTYSTSGQNVRHTFFYVSNLEKSQTLLYLSTEANRIGLFVFLAVKMETLKTCKETVLNKDFLRFFTKEVLFP